MFKRNLLALSVALAAAQFPLSATAADDADLARLRAEFDQKLKAIQADYEARLQALEARAAQAVAKLETRAAAEPAAEPPQRAAGAPSFNPQMSVILDGVYYAESRGGQGVGFMDSIDGINRVVESSSHVEPERGFNLRETELAFSSTVDPYFDANLLLTVASNGSVKVEEAYFDTRELPEGLKLRGGKFLSGIGYHNGHHPHTWDFVDQNLPYRTLLGEHGVMDTGLQLSWLPKTGNVYTLLGVELLQGNDQTFATAGVSTPTTRADGAALAAGSAGSLDGKKAGPRLVTAYAKLAPDLGDDHALQFGLFGARANQHQETLDQTADDAANQVQSYQGTAWLWGTDWVYKYDAAGAYGQGDFKLTAEYLREHKDLKVAFHEDGTQVGQMRKFTQDGFYLAGVYGFAPNWQVGLRYDVTGLTNKLDGPDGRLWDKNESDRWTLSLTRHLSEFSRLRLQASTADLWVEGAPQKLNQLFIQYQHSLGAHGAHKF